SGSARRAIRRAVLTGGGSLLVGARETAEKVIGVKTRLGRPVALSGAPEMATAPQFSVAVGALQMAARERSELKSRSARGRASGYPRAASGAIGQIGAWIRANF
ncbi:MAG TPA: hypothetical protein PKM48_12135, partial [Parvularculaceae bacterium]|nr:hypothetical protein [Parvularculaceae bacterium]